MRREGSRGACSLGSRKEAASINHELLPERVHLWVCMGVFLNDALVKRLEVLGNPRYLSLCSMNLLHQPIKMPKVKGNQMKDEDRHDEGSGLSPQGWALSL